MAYDEAKSMRRRIAKRLKVRELNATPDERLEMLFRVLARRRFGYEVEVDIDWAIDVVLELRGKAA